MFNVVSNDHTHVTWWLRYCMMPMFIVVLDDDVCLTSLPMVHDAWQKLVHVHIPLTFLQGRRSMLLVSPVLTTCPIWELVVWRAKMAVFSQHHPRSIVSLTTAGMFRVVAKKLWHLTRSGKKALPAKSHVDTVEHIVYSLLRLALAGDAGGLRSVTRGILTSSPPRETFTVVSYPLWRVSSGAQNWSLNIRNASGGGGNGGRGLSV